MRAIVNAVLIVMLLLVFGCGKKAPEKKEYTLLVRMLQMQQKYFENEVVRPFEKQYNCKITLVAYDKMWDLENILKVQREKPDPNVLLVKVPFEMTRALAEKGYMEQLHKVTDSAQVEKDMAEYHPLALGLGYVNHSLYYVPRKLETRLLFYLKSKVKDASANWRKFEKALNTSLKEQNGYGLPKGYNLEEDPEQWDYYDILVAGYYWANTQYFNVNVLMPRVAHRADRYEGTALGLVDMSVQFGATSKQILSMDAEPVTDMYMWEAAFIRNGVYNPEMWNGAWRGTDIYKGIQDGKVFLTVFQQIDCFNVHGWEDNPEMRGYLKDPSDMGVATIPAAVSFELNKDGTYARTGTKQMTTGGWWWGIPQSSPDKKLAYELARFITNHDNQANECSKFGMVPVRKDIMNRIGETFEMGWVGDIFRVSVSQLEANDLATIPLDREYGETSKNYIEAWYDLCVNPFGVGNTKALSRDAIKQKLNEKFIPAQKQLLSGASR
ncbi:MAG: carbohydrate ABC transporter substrate-binding protein [Fibrobacteres bacterium]|nr:carbohydrate ABC transporter substrate-binding protein [Fibrobacterota bacterium]